MDVTYLNAPGYQNLVFEYDYDYPQYYRIDVPDNISEYFILENRLREGFDLWTPNDPNEPTHHPLQDPNGNAGGLFIWHIDDDSFVNYNSDIVYYKSAGRYDWYMEDPFPYLWGDMYGSGENLTYLTNPNSRLRDGSTDSGIEILNITWNGVAKNCTLDITHTYNSNFNVIAENTKWSGMNFIDRDTYIMGGAKLTLAEGCIVKVKTYPRLKL